MIGSNSKPRQNQLTIVKKKKKKRPQMRLRLHHLWFNGGFPSLNKKELLKLNLICNRGGAGFLEPNPAGFQLGFNFLQPKMLIPWIEYPQTCPNRGWSRDTVTLPSLRWATAWQYQLASLAKHYSRSKITHCRPYASFCLRHQKQSRRKKTKKMREKVDIWGLEIRHQNKKDN